MRANEKARAEFETAVGKCTDLHEQIQGYMKKFDDVKVEVESNSSKFQTVISDIETKRIDL